MSDTPETDSEQHGNRWENYPVCDMVSADFACMLVRKLNETVTLIAQYSATVVRLERERDEAREALLGRTVSCSQCNEAAKQLEAMREAIKEAIDSLNKCSRVIGAPKTYEWADEDVCDAAYNSAQTTLTKLQPFIEP